MLEDSGAESGFCRVCCVMGGLDWKIELEDDFWCAGTS